MDAKGNLILDACSHSLPLVQLRLQGWGTGGREAEGLLKTPIDVQIPGAAWSVVGARGTPGNDQRFKRKHCYQKEERKEGGERVGREEKGGR